MRTVERILLVPIGAELAGAVAIARYITPPVHSLSLACFGLLDARGKYRLGCSASGLAPTPLRQWACTLALLMAPICPHWAKEVWSGPLAMPGCIVRARWPCPDVPVDASLAAAGDYLFSVAHSLSGSLSNFDKKAAKGKAGGKAGEPAHRPNQINVYVVTRFPDWKIKVLELLQSHFSPETNTLSEEVFSVLATSPEIKAFNKGKGPQQFAASMREASAAHGASALALT